MRVLVLGAGYAGVVLTRRLEETLPADVELVVVDESGTHLVQHELHRAIRRPAVADTISIPLDDLFDRATIREGTVTRVDTDDHVVELADGETLDYDAAGLCLGARTNYYGMDDVERHAHQLKRLPDAAAIRADALDAFETPDPTLVVGGAGLAGVQTAGELVALASEQETDADVILLEQAARVAPTFEEAFGRAIHAELVQRDVDVRTGVTITGATASTVELESADGPGSGTELDADVFVWTGGIRGPNATDGSRIEVRASLDVDDRTFVVGDTARVIDDDGRAVPASAQAAVREARVAAENIHRVVTTGSTGGFRPHLDRFVFESPGWLVSIGDGAVAQVGSTVLRGDAAKTIKAGVGAGYLASAGRYGSAIDLLRTEIASGPRTDDQHEE